MTAIREALHQISLCSQNSASSKEECGRIARAALAAQPCPQINSGVLCGVPRKHDERLCPDCNPQPAQPSQPRTAEWSFNVQRHLEGR